MARSFEEWLTIVNKESLDQLKEDKSFKFCKNNLYKHFNISQKMLAKICRYLDYDIKPLTRSRRMTTEEFIELSNKTHNGIYDYSKVAYVNGQTKVEIICKEHGSFWQNPNSHYNRGDRCPKCGLESRASKSKTSLEEFKRRANEVHKDKFDYSRVVDFDRLDEKMEIGCPKHGWFEVTGRSHLQGYDCVKCSYELRGAVYLTKVEAMKRLKGTGTGFVYDISNFKTVNSIISYTCPTHGVVDQKYSTHIRTKCCHKCKRSIAWNKSNTEGFIVKAKEVHKNYYTYDKVKYEKNSVDVVITCRHHGDFNQRPNTHLLGAGCPVCANIASNFNKIVEGEEFNKIEASKLIPCYIYLMYFKSEEFYKIGISRDVKNRLKGIRYSSDLTYKPTVVFKSLSTIFTAASFEDTLFNTYQKYRYKPKEYFHGHTECFNKNLPVNEIISLMKEIEQK